MTPQPGDIFLSQIRGTGGWLIRLAQGLTGDWSRFTHAGIVLDDWTVLAAHPGGASIDTMASVLHDRPVAFTRYNLDGPARAAIVAGARARVGTPYSFTAYLMLGMLALGIRPRWLRARVAATGHMICSQLADQVYLDAGVHLFDDGRAPGDVTPGDLAHVGTIWHVDTGPHLS